MDARTKAVKAHRKRMQKRRMKRVEVTVRERDAALVRQVAAALRSDNAEALRIRTMLRGTTRKKRDPTVSEVISSLPDISGQEFDAVFEEIERFRHDPVMMKVRDIEL